MVEKKYNRCACGETINKGSKQCRKCRGKAGSTAASPLPNDNQIIREVNKTSTPKVAAKYGVSVTTIKRILLKYPNYKNMK
jgi:hypothetical protein